MTLGLDLFRLVETHSPGVEAPSAAFRKALLDDGLKTQDLVLAFIAMTPPRPTYEYDELMKKCQESMMKVRWSL